MVTNPIYAAATKTLIAIVAIYAIYQFSKAAFVSSNKKYLEVVTGETVEQSFVIRTLDWADRKGKYKGQARSIQSIDGQLDVGLRIIPENSRLLTYLSNASTLSVAILEPDDASVMSELVKFPNLTSLRVEGVLSPSSQRHLLELKSLEELTLVGPGVSAEVLNNLLKSQQLHRLFLEGGVDENCFNIDPRGNKLSDVCICVSTISNTTIANLAKFPNLRNIKLAHLGGDNLRGGVKELINCNSLDSLQLIKLNFVNDQFLEEVADSLQSTLLVLARCSISDKGLQSLAGNSKMSELYLASTNVTEDGVEKFRVATPWCKVERYDGREAGFWVLCHDKEDYGMPVD